MIPINLFVNLCLGFVFALCARERLRLSGAFPVPVFWLVLMYIGALEVPFVIYMYMAHPAWSWLYLVNPESVPGLAIIGLVLVHAGAIAGAWYMSAWLIHSRRASGVLFGALASGAAAAGMALLCAKRLTVYGSYRAYAEGTATPLMEAKLGYVLIAVIVGMATAYGLVAWELLRDSRRLRNR